MIQDKNTGKPLGAGSILPVPLNIGLLKKDPKVKLVKFTKPEHNIARNCRVFKIGTAEYYQDFPDEDGVGDSTDGVPHIVQPPIVGKGGFEYYQGVHKIRMPNTYIFSATIHQRKGDDESMFKVYDDRYYIIDVAKFYDLICRYLWVKIRDGIFTQVGSNKVEQLGVLNEVTYGIYIESDVKNFFTEQIQFESNFRKKQSLSYQREARMMWVIRLLQADGTYNYYSVDKNPFLLDITEIYEELKKYISLISPFANDFSSPLDKSTSGVAPVKKAETLADPFVRISISDDEHHSITSVKEKEGNVSENLSKDLLKKALASMVDFELPDRIIKTVALFEESLSLSRHEATLVHYMNFLNRHNLPDVLKISIEVLGRFKEIARNNSMAALSQVFQTQTALADLYLKRSDYKRCQSILLEASESLETLKKKDPSVIRAAEVGEFHLTFGNYQSLTNTTAEARGHLNTARSIFQKLEIATPGKYPLKLAQTLDGLASLEMDLDTPRAIEHFTNAIASLKPIVESDEDAMATYGKTLLNYSVCLRRYSPNAGDLEDRLNECLAVRRKLHKKNPLAYNEDLALTLNNLANYYTFTQGNPDRAIPLLLESISLFRTLFESDRRKYSHNLSLPIFNYAMIQAGYGNYPLAVTHLNEVVVLLEPLAGANPSIAKELAETKAILMKIEQSN